MTIRINGRSYVVDVGDVRTRPVIAVVDGERIEVWPEPDTVTPAPQPTVSSAGGPRATPAPASADRQRFLHALPTDVVCAPLPGVIRTVAVRAGAVITAGQELCVIEAMKMKNPIHAPRDGRIAAVHINVDQHVRHGDALVTYAEAPPP